MSEFVVGGLHTDTQTHRHTDTWEEKIDKAAVFWFKSEMRPGCLTGQHDLSNCISVCFSNNSMLPQQVRKSLWPEQVKRFK